MPDFTADEDIQKTDMMSEEETKPATKEEVEEENEEEENEKNRQGNVSLLLLLSWFL